MTVREWLEALGTWLGMVVLAGVVGLVIRIL